MYGIEGQALSLFNSYLKSQSEMSYLRYFYRHRKRLHAVYHKAQLKCIS